MTTQVAPAVDAESVSLGTWLRFMLGDRQAILALARSTDAVWVGLLFVLSAGLAREYDGEYLLYEPWHALLPLAASLVTSLFLYALVYAAAYRHEIRSLGWWSGYRTLLTFYWMTAPLAWLYAIPVERFLDPAQATRTNFALLAIVSVWRVLLITRAISVWLGASYARVMWIVLFFGVTVLLIASFITPMPLWDVMGGIRLPEREQVIVAISLAIRIFCTIAWHILLIAACIAILSRTTWLISAVASHTGVSLSMWLFAILLLCAGYKFLDIGQPEQEKRWHAEYLLRSGHVAEGVRYMAETPRSEFPPQWDPPPRTSYGENKPSIDEVIAEIYKVDAPSWVRDVYTEKLLSSYSHLHATLDAARNGKPHGLNAMLDFLEHLPPPTEGQDLYWQLLDVAKFSGTDAALRERIQRFLKYDPAAK
jgi:hypothetical protein